MATAIKFLWPRHPITIFDLNILCLQLKSKDLVDKQRNRVHIEVCATKIFITQRYTIFNVFGEIYHNDVFFQSFIVNFFALKMHHSISTLPVILSFMKF